MPDRVRYLTEAQFTALEALKADPGARIPDVVGADLVALGLADASYEVVPLVVRQGVLVSSLLYRTTARAWQDKPHRLYALSPEATAIRELRRILAEDVGPLDGPL
jgi:hypothetical protein